MKRIIPTLIAMIFIFILAKVSFGEELKKGKGGYGSRKSDTYQEEFTFDVITPSPSVKTMQGTDGNNYQLFSFDDYSFTTETGKPKLPFFIQNVYLPPAATTDNVKIEIVSTSGHEETLLYPVYPAEEVVWQQLPGGINYADYVFNIDHNFYDHSQGFYPQTKVQIQEIGNIRGLQYASVKIFPYQYDPSTKKINIDESLTLKLTWTSKYSLAKQPPQTYGRTFDTIVTNLNLLNFNQSLNTPGANQGIVRKLTQQQLMTGFPTDYLIIAADDFYNNSASCGLDALANHRASSQGGSYRVSIVKASDIYATAFPDKLSGNITAKDKLLKIFIKYAYTNWNISEGIDSHLEFVLLAGDAITESSDDITQRDGSNLVPTHISTYSPGTDANERNGYDRIATDYWYSCISDSGLNYLEDPPDPHNDTFDEDADVMLGRFPAQSSVELQRIINKTINLETTFANQAGLWRSQTGLLNGFQISDDHVPGTKSYFDIISNEDLAYYPIQSLVFNRADLSNDDAGRAQYNSTLKSNFNDGRLLTVVSTHGSRITWNDGAGTIFCAGNINCQHDEVLDLTNNQMPSIIFTASCQTAWFDDPDFKSLAESFLTNNDAGAVAYVGASRDTYLTSLGLIEGITKEISQNHNFIFGSDVLIAKNNFPATSGIGSAFYRVITNLLGDPALNLSRVIQQSTKPDLSCKITNFDTNGNNATFHTKIKNSGLSNANNVLVQLYQNPPASGGVKVAETTIPLIASNQEVSQDITIPLQPGWETGAYFFLLADGNNQIAEVSETNNTSNRFYFSLVSYDEIYIGNGNFPSINGNKIVWRDKRNNRYDIYMYDLGQDGKVGGGDDSGEVVLTADLPNTARNSPAVYENKISGSKFVWQGRDAGKSEIYALDLGTNDRFDATDTKIKVSENSLSGNFLPAVEGNKIAWKHNSTSAANLYQYDMVDGILGNTNDLPASNLDSNSSVEYLPAISGNKIVWEDSRDDTEIYLYDFDLRQEFRITNSPLTQSSPKISGNKIVWQDNRNGHDNNIYLYDLGPDGRYNTHDSGEGEFPVTLNSSVQQFPAISGNKIVWQDLRNQSYDFYMYDLGPDGRFGTSDDVPETRIAIEPADYRSSPIIYDNKIVYSQDTDGAGYKVYMIDLNDLHTRDIYVPRDYSSIQFAINSASNGYTIHVAPGTYNGPIDFAGKNIKVIADQGPSVTTLQLRDAYQQAAVSFHSNESRAAVLQGFNIVYTSNTYFGYGIKIENASPTLIGNTITANPGIGISAAGSAPLIKNNTISNCSDAGINIQNGWDNLEIANNTISNNQWSGIQALTSYGVSNVHHNLIKNNAGYGIYFERCSGNYGGSDSQIANNTIANNNGGILFLSSSDFKVSNNVISSNGYNGIAAGVSDYYRQGGECSNIYNSYNDFWGNITNTSGQGIIDGLGIIYLDPKLDGSNHLQPGSPCINAGDPTVFDLDGSRSDIGAFYFDLSLVKNSSFELDSGTDFYPNWTDDDRIANNNLADGWTTGFGILDTLFSYDGSKSMKIYVNNSRGYSVQDVPIERNKIYKVSGYVKTDCVDNNCYGTILTECMDANHTNIWGYDNCKLNTNPSDIQRLYGDNDWTKVEFTVQADNPNASFLRTICYNTPYNPYASYSYPGTGTVWCDAVNVVEVAQ